MRQVPRLVNFGLIDLAALRLRMRRRHAGGAKKVKQEGGLEQGKAQAERLQDLQGRRGNGGYAKTGLKGGDTQRGP